MDTEKRCGDCGCREGELHLFFPNCDMECCPDCGGQLMVCGCPPTNRRFPYIEYPIICGYCGTLWPDLFMVPDEEWEHYIQPNMRDKVLCRDCYNRIKKLVDSCYEKEYPEQ